MEIRKLKKLCAFKNLKLEKLCETIFKIFTLFYLILRKKYK